MKMTMKRALALLIALLLAVPNFALAELPETFIESVQVESEYGDTEMALGEDAGDASADAGTGSVSADLYDPTPVEAIDDIPAAPSDASEIAAEGAPEEGDIAGAPEGGDVEGQPEEGELLDLPEEDLPEEGLPEEGPVEEGQAGEEQPEDAGEAMSEPFNRSEVLDGVIVTVQAAPGCSRTTPRCP